MAARSGLSRRLMSMLALAPVCFLGTMVATQAQAGENYALIVAASDYPNLDPKYWLKGPKNDEALIRDYLLHSAPVTFEPQNVVALGSGEGMELGTHKAILDNLAKIASEAKAGDFVYLNLQVLAEAGDFVYALCAELGMASWRGYRLERQLRTLFDARRGGTPRGQLDAALRAAHVPRDLAR